MTSLDHQILNTQLTCNTLSLNIDDGVFTSN